MEETIVWGRYLIPDLRKENVIEDGSLCIRGDRIIDSGDYKELLVKYPLAKQIGGSCYLVMPGLIDSHQHGRGLAYIQRGILDEEVEIWIQKLRGMLPLPTYLNTIFAAMKLIETGVTCAFHYNNCFSPLHYEQEVIDGIKAYKDIGLRVAFAIDIRDQNTYAYQDDGAFLSSLPPDICNEVLRILPRPPFPSLEEYFTYFDKFRTDYEDNRTKILMAPQSTQLCSDKIFEAVKEKSEQVQCGVQVHLMETMYQKKYFIKNFGKTAVRYLYDLGFWKKGTSCAHSVWLTQEDIDILSDKKVVIVHNPSSNLRLRSGIAPVCAMLDAGIDVALGMDGLSINDDSDIFNEMRLCINLHNQPGIGKRRLSCGQVFNMVTIAGAKVTTFENDIGTLEIGKKADLVLMRYDQIVYPYLPSNVNPKEVVLGRGKSLFVDTVIVDGSIIMENRKFSQINSESIIEALTSAASATPNIEILKRRELINKILPFLNEFYLNMKARVENPFYFFNSKEE